MRTSIVMGVSTVLLALCLAALLAPPAHAQKVCPACTCAAEYEPVCAFNLVSRRYRGFSSPCVLSCMNECRGNRFMLHAKGRCGKARIQSVPTPSPSPATSSQPPSPPVTTAPVTDSPVVIADTSGPV